MKERRSDELLFLVRMNEHEDVFDCSRSLIPNVGYPIVQRIVQTRRRREIFIDQAAFLAKAFVRDGVALGLYLLEAQRNAAVLSDHPLVLPVLKQIHASGKRREGARLAPNQCWQNE